MKAQFINNEANFINAGTPQGAIQAWQTRKGQQVADVADHKGQVAEMFSRDARNDPSPQAHRLASDEHAKAATHWREAAEAATNDAQRRKAKIQAGYHDSKSEFHAKEANADPMLEAETRRLASDPLAAVKDSPFWGRNQY